MTDRIHSLTVVLDHDMRDDDIQPLIDAIKMMKGVRTVDTHVSDIASHMAEARAFLAAGEELVALASKFFKRA